MLNKPTQKRLKELLHYDPRENFGDFTWKVDRNFNAKVGDKAGFLHSKGYIHIKVDGKQYKAHRLAWLYEKGYLPENQIDHRDRIRNHNWICNLRESTQICNSRNCKLAKNNSSGVTGVHWAARDKRWPASIGVPKKINLGNFIDKLEAVKARWEAEKRYNFPDCSTISAAYLYLQEREIV